MFSGGFVIYKNYSRSRIINVAIVRDKEYTEIGALDLFDGGYSMDYITSADCAKKWNVSQRRVAIFCKAGRVDGAIMMGRMWMIPKTAQKPEDPRKSRKKS